MARPWYRYQPGLGVCDNLSVCVLCPLSGLTVNTIKIHSPSPACCQEPSVQSITRQQWPWSGPGLHTLTGVTSGQVKTNSDRGENTGEERIWGDNNIPDDHRPAHTQPHVSPKSQRLSRVIIIINTREAIIININNSNTPPRPNGWPVTRGEETSHSGAPPRPGWPR